MILGLRTAGFSVAAFTDATAFLTSLDISRPDMLVLDWLLPDMNGGALLKHLQQMEGLRSLPVLVLTNLSGIDGREIALAFASGALAWLEKSRTTPIELALRIGQALRN